MLRSELRIVPWRFETDLTRVGELLYPSKYGTVDLRHQAIKEVKCWASRGPYVPHTVESTAHLTEAKLLDEQVVTGETVLQLSYTMAMIRFVNGLLDPMQQSQFAIPLHVLAERMGLPSWFVELRHCGTHEREMPSLDMLRVAVDQALEWLWVNYWNAEPVQNSADEKTNQTEVEETPLRDAVTNVESVDKVMKKVASITNLLIKNPDLGKAQRVSSSFTGDAGPQIPPSKKRKSQEKPEDKLERFVLLAKETWRGCKSQPDIFLEKFIGKYNSSSPLILELLTQRIQPFGFELSRWILQNYQMCLKSEKSPLRQAFDASQLKRFLSEVCKYALNVKMIIVDWEKWSSLLREYPNWISLQILQSCETDLITVTEKFRRRYQSEIADLKELSKRFQKCVLKSELTMYQLTSSARPTSSTAASKSSVANSTNEILNDLRKLKQNVAEKKIYAWEPVENWTPRPFGQT
ncbi:LAFA_0G04874g1_1 [Lachancea sp. 'fantastica']|nr:LAFA_0G04874g1_1 [Lachancea sp. 'fantastica']